MLAMQQLYIGMSRMSLWADIAQLVAASVAMMPCSCLCMQKKMIIDIASGDHRDGDIDTMRQCHIPGLAKLEGDQHV